MKNMKITILSGGSGNDAILKGIKQIYPESDVKVILNAYDNGKSTGICRAITNTLGVSDIRKNHIRLYKIQNKEPNQNILDFFDKRIDFDKGQECKQILKLLKTWGLDNKIIVNACKNFFKHSKCKDFEFKDFSVANIIYSSMYETIGYEKTNAYFCNLLGIDDFVILNSFDNVYLKAITENKNKIDDEGELVEWKQKEDKIIDTYLEGENKGLNPKAIDRIMQSDLIIHSTGTFWSSIYPTMQYLDFYKYINLSKAKKIWVMNTEEDKDSYGVKATDFVSKYAKLGLFMNQWDIIQNNQAVKGLRNIENAYNFDLGNNKGKNNSIEVAKAIFSVYFGITNKKYDKILLDFDNTLYGKQGEYKDISKKNIENVANKSNVMIISGNSIKSIKEKVNINELENKIWADANSTCYYKGKKIDKIKENDIKDFSKVKKIIKDLEFEAINNITYEKNNIKIKFKQNNNTYNAYRYQLAHYLNKIFEFEKLDVKALCTGRTTVDIVQSSNDKARIYFHDNLMKYKTLFIGDELDCGNDYRISKCCDNAINVNNPIETNIILNLMGLTK